MAATVERVVPADPEVMGPLAFQEPMPYPVAAMVEPGVMALMAGAAVPAALAAPARVMLPTGSTESVGPAAWVVTRATAPPAAPAAAERTGQQPVRPAIPAAMPETAARVDTAEQADREASAAEPPVHPGSTVSGEMVASAEPGAPAGPEVMGRLGFRALML